MKGLFHKDDRLGISLPKLEKEWVGYTTEEQSEILSIWEKERAKIPDRIKELENSLHRKTDMLLTENDVEAMVQHNSKIVFLASIINDLNIWYRIEPTLTEPIMSKSS
ncbi:hypothetical protein ACERII_11610 [Evansella sp. AB-rgal1]|uniref:hypothetical protein n=1 Tax=Evansella sp. AB-rgal1 TaxID=3242696 RepID=UPI00359EAB38